MQVWAGPRSRPIRHSQSTGHGGAGIYLRQGFVHADTGAVRSWRG